ncbi:MAG: hypothetical protein QOE70_698 [Chthoniobacter sp.]|nr:hypothetical protein [Chthoniobacter sp.]
MRVAVLNASISRRNGGVSEVARRLAQEVALAGAEETAVLGLEDEYSATDAPGWSPLVPQCFAPAAPRFYGYAPGYRAALEAFRPDICHVHGLWQYPSLAARLWSRKGLSSSTFQSRERDGAARFDFGKSSCAGRPYLVTVHGMLDVWALGNSRWKKRLAALLFERRNLREAFCLHAITEAEVRSIRDFGLRNPVCLIPNAVDLPAVEVDPGPAPWEGTVPPGQKILLYLGRIHPKKGLLPLLRGWSALTRQQARAQDWTLVIAGWDQGGHAGELRKAAAELGITDRVVFPGPLFDRAKALAFAHADAFVLPSFSEGLPLVVLEAWAHRCPVLMTEACNLPEGFQCGAALRLAPDEARICATLEELLTTSEADRSRMGERGRNLVEARFTWPLVGRQMHSVYRWMAGETDAPDGVEPG